MTITQLHLPDSPDHVTRVHGLLEAATQSDGVAPFSEQFLLGLADTRLGHQHLLVHDGGTLVGVLAQDRDQAELVVHPAYRRHGWATMLQRAASMGLSSLSVWAHGNLPAAQGLASHAGAKKTRELLVMATAEQTPATPVPEGCEVISLAQARAELGERADHELLRVNNEAFDWHPEQGGWDMARWERAQESDWFRPEDVLLLVERTGVAEPTIMGFHWTKWLIPHSDHDAPAEGEVYVVGLGHAARGKRLGLPLISAGVEHLWGKGAELVKLYVESDNSAAVRAYERLGFRVVETHAVYTFPAAKE